MEVILLIALIAVAIKCIGNKISTLAMLMYIQEHGNVPSKEEIEKYTNMAAKKFFHIPS